MSNPTSLADNVRTYLAVKQWSEKPPGNSGSLWVKGRSDGSSVTVAVPFRLNEDTAEWRGIVERVADYEKRPRRDIGFRLANPLVDVTRLRAANDYVINSSIPLSAGAGLVGAAYRMLRASATTARRPQAHIGGNFSRLGDQIAAQARLGHTEEGSYIVPILMQLSDVSSGLRDSLLEPEPGVERVSPEPPERRVTRTFAQAVTVIEKRIVEPAREPRATDMHDVIAAGASRELVLAVSAVLLDPAVAEFKFIFDWSPSATPPAAVPPTVTVPADANELLIKASRLLTASKRDPQRTIIGPIVEVRHIPGDLYGEVALQTVRNGRQVEVRVRLNEHQLDPTHDWMRTARTVVVEGVVQRAFGQRLRIDNPNNIYPLDETYLANLHV